MAGVLFRALTLADAFLAPLAAPSYFSQYFLCQIRTAEDRGEDIGQAIKTLYIDRDPVTFRDIALHLQGYHIQPRDGTHFVRLFADAQFYNRMWLSESAFIPLCLSMSALLTFAPTTVPKLISQLHDESIFISIGHREFQIPRDLLTDPGNSPNYFSLGFALFFSQPDELFPGLDREGLIRPPSIQPPSVPNRSADTFADLLRLLRGYPVHIRDETHRQELLRDARYFHFKGLEQRLVPHSITFNPLRQRDEIVLRLENVQKSGVSVIFESTDGGNGGDLGTAWVNYGRPYVDERPAELVLEIGGDATRIHFTPAGPRAEFFKDTKARVARLLEVITTKLNLPLTTQPLGLLMASGGAGSQLATPGNTPLSDDLVRVAFEAESSISLDGKDHDPLCAANGYDTAEESSVLGDAGVDLETNNPRKRRRADSHGDSNADSNGDIANSSKTWAVKTGHWKLRIQSSSGGKSAVECVLVAVKLDAASSERGRNRARGFLEV